MRASEAAISPAQVGDVLAAAVREAGALALNKFKSSFKTWTKEHDSPVSEVDIAVNDLLRERLMTATPDYGWLSEESVDDPARLKEKNVWIVDPIDGTRAFIAGRDDWVISAALVYDGRPVLGAIYAPVEDMLLLARAGEGTTRNGIRVMARTGAELRGALTAGPKRFLDALVHQRIDQRPRVHSLALRLARVATGTLDLAFAGSNSHDWDIAAADLIVHEAGGAVTDFAGRQIVYNRARPVHDALFAAGRERHSALIRLIRSAPAAFALPDGSEAELRSNDMADGAGGKQLLHLVFGGELDSLGGVTFRDLSKVEMVGVYPNYATAHAAWKAKAQQTVDNAHMRYFIVHLHRLLDPDATLASG